MATTTETLRLLLIGEDKSASKSINGVKTAIKGVATAVSIAKLAEWGSDAVGAFRGAERSQRELTDAYSRFPAVQSVSIEKLREYNQELQNKVGADADDIASGQAVLARYKLTGEQLQGITPLLVDYSKRTGKDLPASAELLGKSIMGNAKAMKTLGINFKDTGDPAKNLEQVVAGLQDKVGGFAEGEATTLDGRLDILKARMGDLQEEVGGALVPALEGLVDLGGQALDWADEMGIGVQEVGTAVGVAAAVMVTGWTITKAAAVVSAAAQLLALGQTAVGWAVSAGAAVASGAETVAIWAMLKGSAIAGAAATVAANVRAAASWVMQNGAMIATSVASKAVAAAQWLVNAAMSANPIGIVVVALAALAAGLVWAYQNSEEFRAVVDGAFKAVAAAGRWLWNNALAPALRGIVNGFAWVVDGAANMLDALGNVPGFEWAKTAAANMRGTAAAARGLANDIKDIPEETKPKVETEGAAKSKAEVVALDGKIKSLKGKLVKAQAEGMNPDKVQALKDKIAKLEARKVRVSAGLYGEPGRTTAKVVSSSGGAALSMRFAAKGGVLRGRDPIWVGEQGPELLWPDGTVAILDAAKSAALAAAQSSPVTPAMGRVPVFASGAGGGVFINVSVSVPRGADGYAAGRAIREELLKLKNGPLRGVGLGLT